MPDAPEAAPPETEEAPAGVDRADEPAKEEAEAAAGGGEAADAEDAGEAVEGGEGEEEEEEEEEAEEDDGSPPPPSSFAGHHIDRLKQDASYVVFYGVTAEGEAHMIAAGLDTRFSGHFVYQSHPKLPGEALRCTNRNVVMEWLRALGATEPVEQQALKEVPDVAADVERAKRLNMLNASRGAGGVIRTRPSTSSQRLPTRSHTPPSSTGRPGSAKEEAPEKLYQTYREEAGELPDGRHYKHYYLVDAEGQDVLAVVAEDGARKDRRYTYKATTAFGGKRFENSRTAQAWLLRFTESGANENEKEGADGDRDGAGVSKHKALSEDAMKSLPVAPDHEHLFHIGADMAAQDLKDAFRDQPPLLGWVTATPSDVLLSTFRLYAGELKAYVGDRPPEFTPEGSPLQTWTPTPRAIEILTHVMHHPVSLSLLDKSGISKPLASLRTHVNYQVATLANRITARWREISDAALQRASEAINSYGTFTQGGHAPPPGAAAAAPAAATPAAAAKADGKPAAAATAPEQQPGSMPAATEAGDTGTGPGDAMDLDTKENDGSGGKADGNAGKSTAAADVAAGTADAPAAAAAEPADAQNGPGDAAMDVGE